MLGGSHTHTSCRPLQKKFFFVEQAAGCAPTRPACTPPLPPTARLPEAVGAAAPGLRGRTFSSFEPSRRYRTRLPTISVG
jgi:hypothetical protein